MKKNENTKNKLFLPFLIAVVVSILFFYFSLLFVEDYNSVINYIFIGLIYAYIYIELYKLFNNRYIEFLKKYINFLKKVKIINGKMNINNSLLKKDKDYVLKLMVVYMVCMLSFVSLLLFVWQLILGIKFIYVTSIISFGVFILSFLLSIFILKRVVRVNVRKNEKSSKEKKKDEN